MKKLPHVRSIFYIVAFILVAGVAWGLRWRAINLLKVDYDEDDYLRAAQQYAGFIKSGDWKGFLETNYRQEHPPLAKIIFGISILPLPSQPLIPDASTSAPQNQSVPKDQLHNARVASAVFGTLESLLLVVVSPLAGVFLAVHSFTIKYTSQVMLEAFPAFTSLVMVLCYLQYKHRRAASSNTKRYTGWLIASAIFFGLTVASKYLYGLIGLAIVVDWLIAERNFVNIKRNLPKIIIWGAIALLVFFISDPYLWLSPISRLKDSLLYHAAYTQGASEVQSADFPIWQPFIWLAQSVPSYWDPGVYVISIDLLISVLAIAGLRRLWMKEKLFVLWLGIAIIFLLIWPTKWPQYILTLTAPLSIAAAEGFTGLLVDPIRSAWKKRGTFRLSIHFSFREIFTASPWLLPGMITLSVLIAFPLIYQLAMAITDFSGPSIRDGIQGGIWREAWLGLTGQITPAIEQLNVATRVHYTGPGWLLSLLTTDQGPSFLVFELLWTVLSVALQVVLGVGIALLLNRKGIRFPSLWRTIFLLPWAIPEFVGALFWLRTFDPTIGWVAQAAGTSGGGGGAIMVSNLIQSGGPNLALLLLLVAATWMGFPFIMLAASASLKLIPYDVYDAAAIDGAGSWSVFRFITWPLLLPLVVPVIIIRSIFAFNQFYLFFVFTPNIGFQGFGTFAYISYMVFKYGSAYSFSAGINVITIVVLIILLILFNRWAKASEGVAYA